MTNDSVKRVLITGADGFTGRYMAVALAAAGYEIHGLVRDEIAGGVAGVKALHIGDLSDPQRLSAIVKQIQPHKVVHLAAIAFVAHGDAAAIYQANLIGTRHLLEALVHVPTAPDAVLLASSANVYGNSQSGILDESIPPAPANDYAVSKLAMEYMAALYRLRLPIIIARPFNYTGVGQSANFLLPKIVGHFRRRADVLELGNLDVARDFSDVRNVVHAYERLLLCPAAIGQTVNISSGLAVSLSEVLAMVRDLSGHDLQVRVNPAFVRSDEVRTLCGSPARLISLIGSTPRIELRETLRWMLATT